MASYPGERPAAPFPYFTEVMTGFEYTAAVGMLQEGLEKQGLQCIADLGGCNAAALAACRALGSD